MQKCLQFPIQDRAEPKCPRTVVFKMRPPPTDPNEIAPNFNGPRIVLGVHVHKDHHQDSWVTRKKSHSYKFDLYGYTHLNVYTTQNIRGFKISPCLFSACFTIFQLTPVSQSPSCTLLQFWHVLIF